MSSDRALEEAAAEGPPRVTAKDQRLNISPLTSDHHVWVAKKLYHGGLFWPSIIKRRDFSSQTLRKHPKSRKISGVGPKRQDAKNEQACI